MSDYDPNVGPDGPPGAQKGRARLWQDGGLFTRGFSYGRTARLNPGSPRKVICEVTGDEPSRTVQIGIKLIARGDDQPRARILLEYGTGATSYTLEVVGDQSISLTASHVRVSGVIEGSSTTPVDVDVFLSYGSTSCYKGSRWRSELLAIPGGGSADFELPPGHTASIFSTSASNGGFAIEQWLTNTVKLRRTVPRGEDFTLFPGCRKITVNNGEPDEQGILVSVELIP